MSTTAAAMARSNGSSACTDLDPVRAQQHARIHEQHRPQEGAGRRVDDEPPDRHARHAGREADERPDDRQQPADEHGRPTVLREEWVRELDLVGADEQVLAEPLQERPPAVCPDGVGDERPERVPDRRGHDHDPEVPGCRGERLDLARVRDEEAGVRQDQLGGQRHHGRFDGHRDQHAEIADGAIQAIQERDDDLVDEGEHANLVTGEVGAAQPSRLSSAS